ncbi:MAG: hypothetical protein KDC53_10150 [Saprospiraceae bacterium]|nr:hypothetical protein [Saprospiraceae bacterium]
MRPQETFFVLLLVLLATIHFAFIINDRDTKSVEVRQFYSSGAFCASNTDMALRWINPNDPKAPLFDGMGRHKYNIRTISPEAQEYFNQGLNLIYGFNHSEAYRSFKECLNIDPFCSMAYWGIAMALGPNINDWIPSMEREQESYEALKKAIKLAASGKEKDIIEALMTRCADTTSIDRDSLNKAYAIAMRTLSDKYPDDLELKVLYADALMNKMPWDYYEADLTAKPATDTVVNLLEEVIAKNGDHPGAHHLYIHIVEASDNPDRGVPSAEHLGALVPAAGHLVHMPAHIYARVGRYEDAAESNRKAINADENYIASCQASGLYPLGYYPHNIHFLWMATTLNGQMEEALDAAIKTADKIPANAQDVGSQSFLAIPLQAYTRFGKWNEVLTTPKPDSSLQLVTGFWHYARAIAFAKKGLFDKSQSEIESLEKLVKEQKNMADSTVVEGQDSAPDPNIQVNDILLSVSEAELAAAKGDYESAIEKLKLAMEVEDKLPYNEPPYWHHPIRQIIGNVYIQSGHYKEAEVVFREDLKKFRDNGWSLFGLYQALDKQGKTTEANQTYNAYKKAWALADIELSAASY